MHPSLYFETLHHNSSIRLFKLRALVFEALQVNWPYTDYLMSYVTVQCLNIWSNFARAYYLSCTLKPISETGSKINLSNKSVGTFYDAIQVAVNKYKKYSAKKGVLNRQDEPAWYRPDIIINCCQEIGCSNYVSILSAFSTKTQVFDHLPKFRNYYAHKNGDTATIAKSVAVQYSISNNLQPTQILLSVPYGRRNALMQEWIQDINITVELLCR